MAARRVWLPTFSKQGAFPRKPRFPVFHEVLQHPLPLHMGQLLARRGCPYDAGTVPTWPASCVSVACLAPLNRVCNPGV